MSPGSKSPKPMARRGKIAVIDDAFRTLRPLKAAIHPERYQLIYIPDDADLALEILQTAHPPVDLVITDLRATKLGGFGLVHKLKLHFPQLPIIITTPFDTILYRDQEFYRYSGTRFLQQINQILRVVLQPEAPPATGAPKRQQLGPLLGQSPPMQELYEQIELVAKTSVTVLLQGETGTGKELVAKTIHALSSRSQGPFVALNCGAIPVNLVESELFGHEKGAFTSAVAAQPGKFELARGGTIFLDEIAELDKSSQVKLLRVLQEKEAQRLGANRPYKTEVRVIAATAKDLAAEVQRGHFREDLFYRLHVMPIYLPPLRERLSDIPLLARHFVTKLAGEMQLPVPDLTDGALEELSRYHYPGNVRELENMLARLLVTLEQPLITAAAVRTYLRVQKPVPPAGSMPLAAEGTRLAELEKEAIRRALEQTGGNKKAAAALLGITRRHLYLKLKRYNLVLPGLA